MAVTSHHPRPMEMAFDLACTLEHIADDDDSNNIPRQHDDIPNTKTYKEPSSTLLVTNLTPSNTIAITLHQPATTL